MANLEKLYQKTGGFIKGVCHPKEYYEYLNEAGIEWVRRDLPYPYNPDGTPNRSYENYKNDCKEYAKYGIRHVTVTPYPSDFIECGIDVTTAEGLAKAEQVCADIAADFAGTGTCWQVTNEMHIRHFRAPLDMEQSRDFLIACIRGMKRGDPTAAVGHNSTDDEYLPYCKQIEEAVGGCDYIGVDLYDGTWSHGGPETYGPFIDHVYEALGIPVILMEFGFASRGGMMTDADGEVDRYLRANGFEGKADIERDLDRFTAWLPKRIRRHVEECAPSDKLLCALNSFPHLMKTWTANCAIAHDEEGQARFYEELLPALMANPHLGGAVIYCMRDSDDCFYCGEPDCPCETAWGLIRMDGSKKPAFETVKRCFKA